MVDLRDIVLGAASAVAIGIGVVSIGYSCSAKNAVNSLRGQLPTPTPTASPTPSPTPYHPNLKQFTQVTVPNSVLASLAGRDQKGLAEVLGLRPDQVSRLESITIYTGTNPSAVYAQFSDTGAVLAYPAGGDNAKKRAANAETAIGYLNDALTPEEAAQLVTQ